MFKHVASRICLYFASLYLVTAFESALAVPVGPKIPTDNKPPLTTTSQQAAQGLPRLDIPDMDIAVIVLNPRIDEEDDKLREKGIWPEVRKTESIRSAYKIRDAIANLKQFERVLVAPSTEVSADLYLRGRIDSSTTEVLDIRWTLIDSRGATWIDWNTTKHRVELGWHDRFYKPGRDPFQPLYNAIARDVYHKLARVVKDDDRIEERNAKQKRRGRATQLTTLDAVTLTRDLVLARFFAPELYSDAIGIKKGQWQINYLPDTQNDDWLKIQAFALRDVEFSKTYDQQYKHFFDSVSPGYESWLNEVFPFAREARLERRRSRTGAILGGAVLLATAGAALDANTTSAKDTIAAVGGLAGSALIAASVKDKKDYKRNLGLFNEMSRNYHDQFTPINVDIAGETQTLQGTASQQFSRWRQVLKEVYDREDSDSYDIKIIKPVKQAVVIPEVTDEPEEEEGQ